MRTDWRARLFLAGTAALAFVTMTVASPPAHAFWIGFGVPFAGYYYGPGPFYAYPPPYAYAPPPAYYPPPAYAAPDVAAAPSAYTPAQPAPGMASTTATPTASAAPAITYTKKPAFTNAAGQTCREYKTTDNTGAHPVEVVGTACKQLDGQWRVTN